jgi:hypothetical protein
VFREPHVGDRWVCRRDESITLPYDELILHTRDAIPYAIPEAPCCSRQKRCATKTKLTSSACCP